MHDYKNDTLKEAINVRKHQSDVHIGALWLFFCHRSVTAGWDQQSHQWPEQPRRNKCFFALEGYVHRSACWLLGPSGRDCQPFCKYTVQLHPLVHKEDVSELYTVAVRRAVNCYVGSIDHAVKSPCEATCSQTWEETTSFIVRRPLTPRHPLRGNRTTHLTQPQCVRSWAAYWLSPPQKKKKICKAHLQGLHLTPCLK